MVVCHCWLLLQTQCPVAQAKLWGAWWLVETCVSGPPAWRSLLQQSSLWCVSPLVWQGLFSSSAPCHVEAEGGFPRALEQWPMLWHRDTAPETGQAARQAVSELWSHAGAERKLVLLSSPVDETPG